MDADTQVEIKLVTIMGRVWQGLRWALLGVLILFLGIVAYRVPVMIQKQKTATAVAFIQSQKLDWATAMGKNLPDAPDEALNNTTLVGTDANRNGIRDDIERAISKRRPDSAPIRSAQLQYALELQQELTQVFNTETWVAEAKYESHAIGCLVDTAFASGQLSAASEWQKEVEDLVFNTDARRQKRQQIEVYESAFVDGTNETCDIEPASLKK